MRKIVLVLSFLLLALFLVSCSNTDEKYLTEIKRFMNVTQRETAKNSQMANEMADNPLIILDHEEYHLLVEGV